MKEKKKERRKKKGRERVSLDVIFIHSCCLHAVVVVAIAVLFACFSFVFSRFPHRLLLLMYFFSVCERTNNYLFYALMYVDTSISSGSSVISTSNLLCTDSSTLVSSAELTNVIARPLVPNLPLRPTRCKY